MELASGCGHGGRFVQKEVNSGESSLWGRERVKYLHTGNGEIDVFRRLRRAAGDQSEALVRAAVSPFNIWAVYRVLPQILTVINVGVQ